LLLTVLTEVLLALANPEKLQPNNLEFCCYKRRTVKKLKILAVKLPRTARVTSSCKFHCCAVRRLFTFRRENRCQ